VYAAKVESVAQLAAGGVCFVVAICKFALIAYQTARHASQLVRVSVGLRRRLVLVAEELFYYFLYGVVRQKAPIMPVSQRAPAFFIRAL
jgi:hypothetical protein